MSLADDSKTPLFVALVVHNHGHCLKQCIETLFLMAGEEIDLYVWDDGSTDGGADILKELQVYYGFQLFCEKRQGVAVALNRLFELANGRDVVRMHGDVVVLTPKWAQRLRATAAAFPGAGVIGVKTILPNGRIQSCGRMIARPLGIRDAHSNLFWNEQNRPFADKVVAVDSVTGTFAFYRAEAIRQTGGVDVKYTPAGMEDDDFCLMARAKNFDVVSDPLIEVAHAVSYPPSEKHKALLRRHYQHWERKWGWNPEFPDAHDIRKLWGNTKIAWQIGRERLVSKSNDTKPPVDWLLVTWNNLAKLKNCLQSLAGTDYPNARLLVLDNGSTDGTGEYLANLAASGFPFPVQIESLPVNIGLPPALNILLARSTAPFLARLDDDIEVAPDWIALMLEDLRRFPFAGCVGGKILESSSDKIQLADCRFWEAPQDMYGTPDTGQFDYLAVTNHVRGCCNLYTREAFRVAGSFDIRYNPSQFDDPDHQVALRAAGFDVIYDGRITVRHHMNTGVDSSPKGYANFLANRHKLFGKWNEDVFEILDRGLDISGRLVEDWRPEQWRVAKPMNLAQTVEQMP